MEEKIEVKRNLLSGARLVIAICVAAALVLLCSALAICAAKLTSDKIYPGVYIGELSTGGMTQNEAAGAIREFYSINTSESLTISCGEETRTIDISTLSPEVVPDEMVEAAYAIGRNGSYIERLKTIFSLRKNHVTIAASAEINEEILLETIHSIATVVDQPEQDNQFEITENELIITRGHSGMRINEEQAVVLVKSALLKKDEHKVELTLEAVNPAVLSAEYIAEQVCGEPQNATYKVENYKLTIIDEKIGVSMDKAEAERILAVSTEDTIKIPVVTQPAEITAKQLESELFSDRLGTYSSRYNAGDTNRSYNVALACRNINDIVLAPGEVFSYNDIVGPRTAARGFRVAHVYVGNKVEDGIGGGICQVSSTLYNTVVLSDLEIVTRTNHSLPVSYVPMGRDATVSYGSIDFKFANNTNSPIKIAAAASGGQCTVSVYGIKENPARTVSIESVRTATYPAGLEQKEDPNLPVGTIEVEQKGSDGSTYQTYKVISENGTVISRKPLAKSTYVAANRIELVGTKPVEATAMPDTPVNAEPAELPDDTPVENADVTTGTSAEIAEPTAAPDTVQEENPHTAIKPANPAA